MSRILPHFLICIIFASGCSNPVDLADRENEAIIRVVKADIEMLQIAAKGREDDGPRLRSRWVKKYRDNASEIDLAGCPQEFIDVYEKFSNCWDKVQVALEKYPTMGEAVADGFRSGLTNSELDLNLDQIKSDIVSAQEELKAVMQEIQTLLVDRNIENIDMFRIN